MFFINQALKFKNPTKKTPQGWSHYISLKPGISRSILMICEFPTTLFHIHLYFQGCQRLIIQTIIYTCQCVSSRTQWICYNLLAASLPAFWQCCHLVLLSSGNTGSVLYDMVNIASSSDTDPTMCCTNVITSYQWPILVLLHQALVQCGAALTVHWLHYSLDDPAFSYWWGQKIFLFCKMPRPAPGPTPAFYSMCTGSCFCPVK
jgi:hypothetical protein